MLHPKISTNKLFAQVCATSPVFRQILKEQAKLALLIPAHILKKAGVTIG